ncbi:GNAT family N-acetyltransferase [Sphingobacterium sp. DN00404]|uniref:GNAT family N-acetyltransferase n=1 Tax=Sphingobacterium micropteri TaxID=2763501 RepID=A0ABR7YQW7_9SPHI|nr:GNAT family N-acetyltransferase [Sphingobacterium micropteri]MBD1433669.1 GNAT family N-acetyltransferase [Sphingobacterium micropteri]
MDIQPLCIQDLPFIRHLQPNGWGDITIHLMEYCLQSFCNPIKVVDGNNIVGVGSLILHGSSAWLGHIIVDESYRGRGIGYKIVKYLVGAAIKSGSSSINLIATDLGVPVYKKVGFRIVGAYQFFKREHDWTPKSLSNKLKVATTAHYEQILKLDYEINGENRKELLENHLKRAVIFEQEGLIEGYYLPQLGQGPIYARTKRAGLGLMELKYSAVDTAVLPVDNNVGIQFLLKTGFEPQRTKAIRMTYGSETLWHPNLIFSRIGGNYG